MAIDNKPIRVAVLDLYDNEPNQGMRCICELLTLADGRYANQPLTFDVYETRFKGDVPDLSYDIYISSGGPGSPFDGIGMDWEAKYFEWLEALWQHNLTADVRGVSKKYGFFICHSFQMMVRHFDVANVTKRVSQSFGIMPMHKTDAGEQDPLFINLADPFYAADFRSWQVVQPNADRLNDLGAQVLALEKVRPHVPYERALMAIRISDEIVGVQFHPEADPPGMSLHFRKPERKAHVVEHHGEEKYERILRRMEDPTFLKATHDHVIPNFLRGAILALRTADTLA